jgi:hypothetical protein
LSYPASAIAVCIFSNEVAALSYSIVITLVDIFHSAVCAPPFMAAASIFFLHIPHTPETGKLPLCFWAKDRQLKLKRKKMIIE